MDEICLDDNGGNTVASIAGRATADKAVGEANINLTSGDTSDVRSKRLSRIPKCPTGLEVLRQYDTLVFEQVYYAIEESDLGCAECCERKRSYTMHVANNFNQEVFYVIRPFKCCAGCCCWCPMFPTCYQRSKVFLSDGTFLGSIKEACALCTRKYYLYDSNGKRQLTIRGRICCASFDGCYKILNMNGKQVGCIKRLSAGFFKDLFANETNFGINCKRFQPYLTN